MNASAAISRRTSPRLTTEANPWLPEPCDDSDDQRTTQESATTPSGCLAFLDPDSDHPMHDAVFFSLVAPDRPLQLFDLTSGLPRGTFPDLAAVLGGATALKLTRFAVRAVRGRIRD